MVARGSQASSEVDQSQLTAVFGIQERPNIGSAESRCGVCSDQRSRAAQVSEAEFDAIFQRIRDRRLPYWADPFRREPNAINTYDDGRGVYFDDPNGHLLEIITRPYGSGGPNAKNPNPLCYGKR